jgi:hypothetical protein
MMEWFTSAGWGGVSAMAVSSLKQQLLVTLDQLTPEQQAQVLDFATRLQRKLPPGIPGEVLIARAREINFPPEDLAEMEKAIEEGCETIDFSQW